MDKKVLYVGLDVDDKTFTGSAICKDDGCVYSFKARPNAKNLIEKLAVYNAEYNIKVCYEAGYLGFSLCRDLIKNNIDCVVIAPSLIPKLPGDHVKTDRLDSEKLAIYFSNNQLTIINLPTEDDEAIRDLLRARSHSLKQLSDTKR